MILFPIPQGFLRLPKTSWELLVSQEDKRRGTGRTAMTCVTGRASGDVGGRRRLGGEREGREGRAPQQQVAEDGDRALELLGITRISYDSTRILLRLYYDSTRICIRILQGN